MARPHHPTCLWTSRPHAVCFFSLVSRGSFQGQGLVRLGVREVYRRAHGGSCDHGLVLLLWRFASANTVQKGDARRCDDDHHGVLLLRCYARGHLLQALQPPLLVDHLDETSVAAWEFFEYMANTCVFLAFLRPSTTESFDEEQTYVLLYGNVITLGSMRVRRPAPRTASAL